MTHPFPRSSPPRLDRTVRAEVGVLTVLPVEMRAVVNALKRMYDYGRAPLAYEAWLPDSRGRHVRVAAVQSARPDAESAALAYQRLVEAYQPDTVVLAGIAAGVAPQVALGDVVLSDRLVTAGLPRIPAQGFAATLGYRIEEFLTAVPIVQERRNGDSFRLHRGPIGVGGAMTGDAAAEIRRWLTQVNDRVLAVESDAAGVAPARPAVPGRGPARLAVRGIADTAYQHRNEDYRELAARHAAEVTAMLVPFLHPGR
jgi:adenosylhomocysteine nucleosidase